MVVDGGQPDTDTSDGDGERYLVLRGPCYVALAIALTMSVPCDGVILVAEAGRSLGADDVTDVLGVPVVATVKANPNVARTTPASSPPASTTSLSSARCEPW